VDRGVNENKNENEVESSTPTPSRLRRAISVLALGIALGLSAAAAAAQSVLPEHLHAPVAVDPGLGWPELMTATLDAHPSQFELAALATQAEAWRDRGRQWVAGAPSLNLSYLSDRMLDDREQRQYSAGLSLPLWRLGQRSSAQALGESTTAESGAAGEALRWEVAGLLRGMLWNIAAAANGVELAEESVVVADELVRVVERRRALGDLSEADLLLARTARFQQSLLRIDREAQLLDAERTYRSLTGLDRRPAAFAEELRMHAEAEQDAAQHEAFDASHPLLALANAEVVRAEAALAFASASVRGNPTLMIGPSRQRDPLTDFYNDSLGLVVTVPFGGARYGATERALAARALAAAQTQRAGLLRQLDLDLHEAEHTLYVVEESLVVAEQQAEVATRQWAMGRSAFEQGEIELRDLLRIQDVAQNATRELARLRIERQRTIAAVNQAIGVLP
jgi:cobalt-zinc-cadmium efflux system outer membrane protein